MRDGRIVVTEDLIRKVNQEAIEGKKYPRDVEIAAASRPRLTPEEINRVWAQVNGNQQVQH